MIVGRTERERKGAQSHWGEFRLSLSPGIITVVAQFPPPPPPTLLLFRFACVCWQVPEITTDAFTIEIGQWEVCFVSFIRVHRRPTILHTVLVRVLSEGRSGLF